MARIDWGAHEAEYNRGLDRGVYYDRSGFGVPWIGLVSVDENLSSEQNKAHYQEGVRYRNSQRPGDYSGTLAAFTHPKNFFDDPLSQTKQSEFDFSFRIKNAENYEIHIVYNCTIKPSSYTFMFQKPDVFNWDFETRPEFIEGVYPSAHLVFKSSELDSIFLNVIEANLYGTEESAPKMLRPKDILAIFEESATLRIIDNGDGT